MKANGANNGPSTGRETGGGGQRSGPVDRAPCGTFGTARGTMRPATRGRGQRAQGKLLAQQSPFNLFCSRGSSPLSLMSLALTIIAAHVAYT